MDKFFALNNAYQWAFINEENMLMISICTTFWMQGNALFPSFEEQTKRGVFFFAGCGGLPSSAV